MANLLYPDVYEIDIVEQTKEFYKLFYNVELTNNDVNAFIQNSIRK